MFVRDKGCCNKTGIVGGTPGLAVVKLLTAVLGSDCAVIDSPVIFQKNRKYKRTVNGTETVFCSSSIQYKMGFLSIAYSVRILSGPNIEISFDYSIHFVAQSFQIEAKTWRYRRTKGKYFMFI